MRIAGVILLAAGIGCLGQEALPLVWVLSTGGTIAGRANTSTDLTQYKPGALTGAELVAAVPEIQKMARVKVEQIANVSSADMTLDIWLQLAKRIDRIFTEQPETAGVVVTHGTNTLEETAYFLNLTVRDERPVVMVGSMRPATAISADGPLNLLNAVRVASAKEARGMGVLIVLNDEISAARDGTKTNTLRVETFRSPGFGYLGYVDGDKISFYYAPAKRHTTRSEFDVRGLAELPAVEIAYSYVQPGTAVLRALLESGAKGIVLAGTGAGLVSRFEMDVLRGRAGNGPVLVRSNRTGSGRVPPRLDYDALGIIPADTLNPQKARILLMLALTKTKDPAEIRRMFEEY